MQECLTFWYFSFLQQWGRNTTPKKKKKKQKDASSPSRVMPLSNSIPAINVNHWLAFDCYASVVGADALNKIVDEENRIEIVNFSCHGAELQINLSQTIPWRTFNTPPHGLVVFSIRKLHRADEEHFSIDPHKVFLVCERKKKKQRMVILRKTLLCMHVWCAHL
jgi:hypothetical protein